MKKERNEKRYLTTGYVGDMVEGEIKSFEVFDVSTNQLVGYLLNLSSGGMMIQTRRAIKESSTFVWKVYLPKEVNDSDQMVVTIKSIWSKKHGSPDFYNNGFEILSTRPDIVDVISVLFLDSILPKSETQNVT